MAKNSVLTTQRDGQVLRWTLSRPERRNALNDDVIRALDDVCQNLDPQIRLVVLEGTGPSFCAGADIDWMRELGEADAKDNRSSALRLARLFESLDNIGCPLVGRVHGHCFGGALGLAAVCDVVVAHADCFFSASEVRLGILPAVIGPYLVSKIGVSRARELMLSGRRFVANEAREMGLVHHVSSADALDAKVDEVVKDLLLGSPDAQAHIKGFLGELSSGVHPRSEWAEWTAEEIARARETPEGQAGLKAFLDKQPPPWAKDA
jgi:methylglutaconyl-CoA hydratase